jgi:hypothetical protein
MGVTAGSGADGAEGAAATGDGIPVRGGSHALVTFNVPAPRAAELVVDYRRDGQILARECRPLVVDACSLEIKTHPEASHIVCAIKVGDRLIGGVRFDADCGDRIEPTGKNLIVIGAMKAGTTTLYHLLTQHSAICRTYAELPGASFTKELNYFNKLYRATDTDVHYDWRFPFDPATHAWTLDVSPNYAKLPRTKAVPSRIAALEGDTKLVYILREPVDRIESNLAHSLRNKGKLARLTTCIRTSQYARHMKNYTAHIPRDDILLLDFRQLTHEPAAALAEISDFLDIDRFVARTAIHNKRGINFRLDASQRAELADILRPDVETLIERFGFEPAKSWLQDRP